MKSFGIGLLLFLTCCVLNDAKSFRKRNRLLVHSKLDTLIDLLGMYITTYGYSYVMLLSSLIFFKLPGSQCFP